jgi:Rap1a immunity proteins
VPIIKSAGVLHLVSELKAALCLGIVSGELYLVRDLRQELRSCPPDGVISGQAVRVVVRYMETHPAVLNESFLSIVLTALHEAWPCRP